MPDDDHDLLLKIKSTLDRVEEAQKIQFSRLYGNGQPGDIAKLDSRVSVCEQFKDTELGRHGLTAAFGAAAATIGAELLHLFIWKR
jgi:hypothetical protein